MAAALYVILMVIFFASLAALILSISIIFGLILANDCPFISMPRDKWKKMCEVAELKPNQVVYDLGCGKANLLTVAADKFGVKGVGYEISLWPYLWGRLRVMARRSNVEIRMKNFFSADVKNADVVFLYLFPNVMTKLEPKFESELKPGAKVVSYAFKLPNRQPSEVIRGKANGTGKIFIYKY